MKQRGRKEDDDSDRKKVGHREGITDKKKKSKRVTKTNTEGDEEGEQIKEEVKEKRRRKSRRYKIIIQISQN